MQASIIVSILQELGHDMSLSLESQATIIHDIEALSPENLATIIHDIEGLIQGLGRVRGDQETIDNIADTLIRASIPKEKLKDTVTWKTVNDQNKKRDIIDARIRAAEMLGFDMREYNPRDHVRFGYIMDRFKS
jgi:hypothetical protein